jgi:hypothetical protein
LSDRGKETDCGNDLVFHSNDSRKIYWLPVLTIFVLIVIPCLTAGGFVSFVAIFMGKEGHEVHKDPQRALRA